MFALLLAVPAARSQQTIATSTPLEIRLTRRLTTLTARKGTPVEAVLIAPVVQDGKVLLPEGSRVEGTVGAVASVGLGFRHETASLGLSIFEIVLPDNTVLKVETKVAQIENSRETINKAGKVQAVRSTSTLSHKAMGAVGTLAFSNPVALLFMSSASASILRFSDPEITLPAGTELVLRLTAPIDILTTTASGDRPLATGPDAAAALRHLVREEPYRTVTDKAHVPSDITNLMLIGPSDAILRAFAAAGWLQVSTLTADSAYKTIRSVSEAQAYRTAPMSTLLLEGRPPQYALAKTLDTFSKRHHLRIFSTQEQWNGQPVWVSSSTQDIGIGFSAAKKTLIHQIDHNVDHERNKVVNDLLLTGCIAGMNLVERSWLPKDMKNGTGETIETDDRMAVLEFNSCGAPLFAAPPAETDATPLHANVATRITRQFVLSLRDTAVRDNLGVTAFGIVKNARAVRHPKPPEAPITPDSEIVLPEFAIGTPVGEDTGETPALKERDAAAGTGLIATPAKPTRADKYPAPSVEIGVHGGWAGYAGGNGNYVGFLFEDPTDPTGNSDIDVALANDHSNGFTLGGSVTLDTNKYISHELTFDYNRTYLNLYFFDFGTLVDTAGTEGAYAFDPAPLSTTEAAYNVLLHLRPKGKRLRPYLLAGPSLRLMHLTDAPVKKASPYFKLGLSTVGSITAAYQYGTTPPLDGGGLFQFGFQYGAGVQYRFARRWIVRADYKETLSAQPDFFAADGSDVFDPADLPGYTLSVDGPYSNGKMRQQRLTSGVSFVF